MATLSFENRKKVISRKKKKKLFQCQQIKHLKKGLICNIEKEQIAQLNNKQC